MKLITRLFWAGMVGITLLALFLIISTISHPTPTQEDYQVRAARTEATISQMKVEAAAGQFWAIFWPIVGAALTGLFIWAVVSELRHRRRIHAIKMNYETSILRPDVHGNYAKPIIQGSVVNVAPGNLQQPVPSSLTYSPHTIYKMGEGRATEQLPPPPVEPPVVETVPTFAELLNKGEIGHGNKILLGYSSGEALRGSWLDLYSSAIAGVSGSGKTTTVRFLAAQSALQGAMFLLIDPHAGAGEDSLSETLLPLAAAFVCNPAVERGEIETAIHIANTEIEARKSDKDRPRTPYIIAVDEFTGLMRGDLAGPLSGLLEKIAQEGRKYGVFALCMGQIWTASRSGGTELRDSFASKYVHRMARNQARLLIPPEESRLVERLPAGQAVLSRTNGELFPVTIPLTTGIDIERVAGMLSARNMPGVSQKYATVEAKILNPDEARILGLFKEGKDVAAIVKEVYGVNTSAGRNYQQLSQQVQAVIRNNL